MKTDLKELFWLSFWVSFTAQAITQFVVYLQLV